MGDILGPVVSAAVSIAGTLLVVHWWRQRNQQPEHDEFDGWEKWPLETERSELYRVPRYRFDKEPVDQQEEIKFEIELDEDEREWANSDE